MASQTKERPKLVRKLEDRRESYRDRGRVYRTLWVAAGITVVLAGLAMTVFPGPAVVVIPAGLAMLSLEFCWAQRLLDRAVDGGMDAKEAVKNASPRQKLIGGVGLALAAAAIVTVGAVVLL